MENRPVSFQVGGMYLGTMGGNYRKTDLSLIAGRTLEPWVCSQTEGAAFGDAQFPMPGET